MMLPTPSHRQRFNQSFNNAGQNLMQAISLIQAANERKRKEEREAQQDSRQAALDERQAKIGELQIADLEAQAQNRDSLSAAETRLVGVDAGLPNQGFMGPLREDPTTQPFSGANPSPLLTNEKRAANEARLKDILVAEISTRRGNPTTAEDLGRQRSEREAKAKAEREDALLLGGLRQVQTSDVQANTAKTKRETELLGLPKPPNPQDVSEANKFARQLKQDFLGNQVTKDYQTIERSAKTMNTALQEFRRRDIEAKKSGKKLDRSALDQTLITLFNKLLDPSSVVRESEYARTPDGMAKIEGLRGKLEALGSGGPGITDTFRDELIASSADLLAAAEQGFAQHVRDTVADAQSYGVEPERVVGGYSRFAGESSGSQGAAGGGASAPVQIKSDAEYDSLPSGADFIGPDGVKRRKP